ncbi:hypothetical protein BJ912DRAFT_871591 [Pholiota molesta]|nr:hypothetical protein BJ912DRAFT_871591 [Pholiota molesta]
MFAKSALFALLAVSVAVEAIPNPRNQQPANCPASNTVTQVQTVTVTARSGAAATSGVVTGANNLNNVGNSGKNTKTAGAGSKTTAAAAGSQTTSAAASSKTTAAAATGNNGDPQTSTTLDPGVIASGFANNGQDVPAAGQVPSLTSTNNFINFCLSVPNLPITNGKQITTGSCNPAPIGTIPSVDNMPSSKFTFPTNFGTIKANTLFTISMAIQNMQTGFFVNAQENYFSAPQQLNSAGQIQGHSHVVIEQLSSLAQTTPTDPKKFVFFKGLNAAAQGGKLTADVTGGLAAGFYKLSSINSAANHQPVIVPIAQHGSLDDAIYFTVTADGAAAAPPAAGKAASTAAAATAASTAAAGKAASTAAAGKAASTAAAATAASTAAAGKAASTTAVGKGATAIATGKTAATSSKAAGSKNGKRRAYNRLA